MGISSQAAYRHYVSQILVHMVYNHVLVSSKVIETKDQKLIGYY
jgi:hypothetical protein